MSSKFIDSVKKYWSSGKNKKIEDNSLSGNWFYLIIVLWFLLVSFTGFKDNILLSLIVLLIPLSLIFFQVSDFLVFYKSKNSTFLKGKQAYDWIVSKVDSIKVNGKDKPKTSFKTRIKKFLYVFTFILIPLGFIFLMLFNANWHDSASGGIGGGTIYSPTESTHYEVFNGTVSVKSLVNEELRTNLVYALGSFVNIPILDLCFVNSGITNPNEIINDTFDSKITLLNQTHKVNYNQSYCIPVTYSDQNIDYNWLTQYKYSFKNKQVEYGSLDISSQAMNRTLLTLNSNFWLMTLLIVITWITVCHLFYSVIKDFNEIE